MTWWTWPMPWWLWVAYIGLHGMRSISRDWREGTGAENLGLHRALDNAGYVTMALWIWVAIEFGVLNVLALLAAGCGFYGLVLHWIIERRIKRRRMFQDADLRAHERTFWEPDRVRTWFTDDTPGDDADRPLPDTWRGHLEYYVGERMKVEGKEPLRVELAQHSSMNAWWRSRVRDALGN